MHIEHQLLQYLIDTFAEKFKKHSAAKSVHHGFIGGLLEHTLSVTKLCDFYTTLYPILNRDLLITAAKEEGLNYAVDVYPYYGSDADVALTAGYDVRHGLIGAGVYASHGYERSHVEGVENTFRLLCAYLK